MTESVPWHTMPRQSMFKWHGNLYRRRPSVIALARGTPVNECSSLASRHLPSSTASIRLNRSLRRPHIGPHCLSPSYLCQVVIPGTFAARTLLKSKPVCNLQSQALDYCSSGTGTLEKEPSRRLSHRPPSARQTPGFGSYKSHTPDECHSESTSLKCDVLPRSKGGAALRSYPNGTSTAVTYRLRKRDLCSNRVHKGAKRGPLMSVEHCYHP